MEKRCQKCGAAVGGEQAFCPKCGAVVGMADAGAGRSEGWDLESTVVGRQLPTTPTRRPTTATHSTSAGNPAASQAQTPRGGNTVLLAIIVFVAVVLIGGLLIYLLYLNSRG